MDNLKPELLFLIVKLLEKENCTVAANALKDEINSKQLVPKQISWQGKYHQNSYENYASCFKHILPEHLLLVCNQYSKFLEDQVPTTSSGVRSLLGQGRFHALRDKDDVKASIQRTKHLSGIWNTLNSVYANQREEIWGSRASYHHNIYRRFTLQATIFGHRAAAYCVIFDRTGRFIITGGDDGMVKIWHLASFRLVNCLRGHTGPITDMTVTLDNRLLATGSCDSHVTVWCLRSGRALTVLTCASSGSINALAFSPQRRKGSDIQWLVAASSNNGRVVFWPFHYTGVEDTAKEETTNADNGEEDDNPWLTMGRRGVKMLPPIKFIESTGPSTSLLCLSFSKGGMFLAGGCSDHAVRVYLLRSADGPEKIAELEGHQGTIDSVNFSHLTSRFATGSVDGSCRIWRFEHQQWHSVVLNMKHGSNSKTKLQPTNFVWSCDDQRLITSVNDFSIRIWDTRAGTLLSTLPLKHTDNVYALLASPLSPHLLVTAGRDGRLIVWDTHRRDVLFEYTDKDATGFMDAILSRDGTTLATMDFLGRLRVFQIAEKGAPEKRVTDEQFLHWELDSCKWVSRPNGLHDILVHSPTEISFHRLPPPYLTNLRGYTHGLIVQQTVPGREQFTESLDLFPTLIADQNNDDIIIDDIQLASNVVVEPGESLPIRSDIPGEQGKNYLSKSHWMTHNMIPPLNQRIIDEYEHESVEQGDVELKEYCIQCRTKPLQQVVAESAQDSPIGRRRKRKVGMTSSSAVGGTVINHSEEDTVDIETVGEVTAVNKINVRGIYDTDVEDSLPGDQEDLEQLLAQVSSDSSQSEFSDWQPEGGEQRNLAPPTRRNCRQRSRAVAAVPAPSPASATRITSRSARLNRRNNGPPVVVLATSRGAANRRSRRRRVVTCDPDEDQGEEESTEIKEESSEEEEERPCTSASVTRQSNTAGPSTRDQQSMEKEDDETARDKLFQSSNLPQEYWPSSWLTSVLPRHSPYVPQMGDEVIYCRQGHLKYLEAGKTSGVLTKVDFDHGQPWHIYPELKPHELMKVVGLKYVLRKPPRLCCLKLAFIDTDTRTTVRNCFLKIEFHDMDDILDFIILNQSFEKAKNRIWKAGDTFRTVIDGVWWHGVVESRQPFDRDHADSDWLCMQVRWENGELEFISPWDLESPGVGKTGDMVTAAELAQLQYEPVNEEDWPSAGREEDCDRIAGCIGQLMRLRVSEEFRTPVDLEAFPIYATVVAYPIDLSTIKSRLENRYYRRMNALQYDIRMLATNAERFNLEDSIIVKKSRLVTELCLAVASDDSVYDIRPIFDSMKLRYDLHAEDDNLDSNTASEAEEDSDEGTDQDDTEESEEEAESGDEVKDEAVSDSNMASSMEHTQARSGTTQNGLYWIKLFRGIINQAKEMDCAQCFIEPVDNDLYPDYQDVITHPMDLSTVLSKLESHEYSTPLQVANDIRQITNNSRIYNTNKTSKIYIDTSSLAGVLDRSIRIILIDWQKQVQRNQRQEQKRHKQEMERRGRVQQQRLQQSSTQRPDSSSTAVNQAASSSAAGSSAATARTRRKQVLDSSSGEESAHHSETEPTEENRTSSGRLVRPRQLIVKDVSSSSDSDSSNSSEDDEVVLRRPTSSRRNPRRSAEVRRSLADSSASSRAPLASQRRFKRRPTSSSNEEAERSPTRKSQRMTSQGKRVTRSKTSEKPRRCFNDNSSDEDREEEEENSDDSTENIAPSNSASCVPRNKRSRKPSLTSQLADTSRESSNHNEPSRDDSSDCTAPPVKRRLRAQKQKQTKPPPNNVSCRGRLRRIPSYRSYFE